MNRNNRPLYPMQHATSPEVFTDRINILYRSCETIRRNINVIQRRVINTTPSTSGHYPYRYLESMRDTIYYQSQLYQSNLEHIEYMYHMLETNIYPREQQMSGNYLYVNGVYYSIDNIQPYTNAASVNNASSGNQPNPSTTHSSANIPSPSPSPLPLLILILILLILLILLIHQHCLL